MFDSLFSHASTSLKICGITNYDDASRLADLGVDAIGVNFWDQSKRYCAPQDAERFLHRVSGRIVRVGVFVNADAQFAKSLYHDGLLDILQFHGDESPEYCSTFAAEDIPFIRAIGVKNKDSLHGIENYKANALLLDAHAPLIYGGSGSVFDWDHASTFIQDHPQTPVMLAGGIKTNNITDAIEAVHPSVIDVASGAELSPGVKDFAKVETLLSACRKST